MASNITLSAGVRQNLLSLQSTAALMSLTQNRLATGKKVNSALDNPANFFTSQSLNNRASDLNSLLDSIGQAQQTLEAADKGITSLTKLVESAKSIAKQARQAPSRPPHLRRDQRHRHDRGRNARHHRHGAASRWPNSTTYSFTIDINGTGVAPSTIPLTPIATYAKSSPASTPTSTRERTAAGVTAGRHRTGANGAGDGILTSTRSTPTSTSSSAGQPPAPA